MAERIAITVNGAEVETTSASSVAAAVMQAQGGGALRQSVTGEPRGPVCGMGICFECRVTIDGETHQRSCQTPCTPGMNVITTKPGGEVRRTPGVIPGVWSTSPLGFHETKDFDVLVVGAGPAGIAAATTAAEAGRRVGVVDDNPYPGGQIWRHDAAKVIANPQLDRLRNLPIEVLTQTQIYGLAPPRTLLADQAGVRVALRCQQLILACGARERFLPFPGWTLPGVFGAGGLQALVKAGYPITGRKVVVAGTGPLLLAVAAYLRKRGADVRLIAEQTPRGKLVRFGGTLLMRQPGKIVEAFGLGWRLRGVPFRSGCWPVRANGSDRLESITLTDGVKTWTEPCDALACGFGLVPNLEMPMLLGCAIKDGFVQVDDGQQTSMPRIFAIGELTGIGGLDKAMMEGQIAGSGQQQPGIAKARQFVALLEQTFALRDELRRLTENGTIVCRCEDVTMGRLKKYSGWRDAKLQTRCGMGPCQGRVCGAAVEFLLGWSDESLRPPLFPIPLRHLGAGIRGEE